MPNKTFSVILFSLLFISCSTVNNLRSNDDIVAKAIKIHDKIFTIDTHADTPLRLMNPEFDFHKRNNPITTHSKMDLPRMKEGGLDAVFFAVYLGQGKRT